jgi:hypothetical protein
MVIPLGIGALWLLAAALFAGGGAWFPAAAALALSPLALGLTVYMRRLKVALATAVYLQEQAAQGIPLETARQQVAQLAPDGVTIETDDIPNWPLLVMLLSTVAGLVAVVWALLRLL